MGELCRALPARVMDELIEPLCVSALNLPAAQASAQVTSRKMVKAMTLQRDLEHLIGYINAVTVAQRAYMISGDEAAIAGIPAMRQDANQVADRVAATIASRDELKQHWARYLELLLQRRNLVNKMNRARKEQGFEAAKVLFDTGEDNRLLENILVGPLQLQAESEGPERGSKDPRVGPDHGKPSSSLHLEPGTRCR